MAEVHRGDHPGPGSWNGFGRSSALIALLFALLLAFSLAPAASASQPRTIRVESGPNVAVIYVHREGDRSGDDSCVAPIQDVALEVNDRTGLEVVLTTDDECLVEVVYSGLPVEETAGTLAAQDRQIIGLPKTSPNRASVGATLLSTSPDTCRSEFHRRDIVNITLTGVNHETRWAYTGSAVALQWISTQLVWSAGTGWQVTSGPSQWVIDGNGGSSDRTHGEGSFKWTNNMFQHTLKVDNKVNANGTCEGLFFAVGTVPGTGFWHYRTVIKD
jgi:hypothetical protein